MKKHYWEDNLFYADMSDIIGRVFSEVEATDDVLKMTCKEGVFTFLHKNDCCEVVRIESIVGDLNDLVGEPILIAEESTGETPSDYKFEYEPDSYTWTFYKFATRKGYVDIRWLGESNGYYSESVEIEFEKATLETE